MPEKEVPASRTRDQVQNETNRQLEQKQELKITPAPEPQKSEEQKEADSKTGFMKFYLELNGDW